jgi:hypothetical protein
LPDDLAKLQEVVLARSSLLVASRSDASNPSVIQHREQAYEQAGCDAVVVDALAAGSQGLAHCGSLLEANHIRAARA